MSKGGKGEGSRGGVVIGHTRHGRPIYLSKDKSEFPRDRGYEKFDEKRFDKVVSYKDYKMGIVEGYTSGVPFENGIAKTVYLYDKSGKMIHNTAPQRNSFKTIKAAKDLIDDMHRGKKYKFKITTASGETYTHSAYEKELAKIKRKHKVTDIEEVKETHLGVKKGTDMNTLNEIYNLIKSGEGSRGGKIIGHTRSGKPVYQSGNDTSGWHHHDVLDAAAVHMHRSGQFGPKTQARRYHKDMGHELHGKVPTNVARNQELHGTARLAPHAEKHGLMGEHRKETLGNQKKEREETHKLKVENQQSGSAFARSLGDDMKDTEFLKSLGITVGVPSLIEHVEGSNISESDDAHQPVRKGMSENARDLLYKGLHVEVKKNSTDYDGTLKNTHGEQFHSDNDKEVEELQSKAEDVEETYEIKMKSLTQEELFLKACGSEKKAFTMAPKQEKDPVQVKEEKKVKDDLLGNDEEKVEKGWMKSINELFNSVRQENYGIEVVEDPYKDSPEMLMNVHENSEQVAEQRVEKGGPGSGRKPKLGYKEDKPKKYAKMSSDERIMAQVKWLQTASPKQKEHYYGKIKEQQQSRKSFIKSAGPGGLLFDFGPKTGNPIADHATTLLNAFADPVQESNVEYQNQSYLDALSKYVTKGEQEYMKTTTPFGNVDEEWNEQLGKSTDQQVKEMFEKGQLDKEGPAIENKFNEIEMNLNGQVIKATSETDAALIEMMKGQSIPTEDGTIADCSTGGRISVTAGEPLPEK